MEELDWNFLDAAAADNWIKFSIRRTYNKQLTIIRDGGGGGGSVTRSYVFYFEIPSKAMQLACNWQSVITTLITVGTQRGYYKFEFFGGQDLLVVMGRGRLDAHNESSIVQQLHAQKDRTPVFITNHNHRHFIYL